MRKLKSIIIDDDPLITDLLVHYAGKTEALEYCVSCNDPVAGLKLIGNGAFDLLFLDLNMPTLNGKNILELKQDNSKVIMVTSDQDFAVDSYRYQDVIDYLVKPVKYDRYLESINRCQEILKKQESMDSQIPYSNKLMVKDGNKWIPLEVDNILFIKSDSNYCIINCTDKTIMSLMNLKNILTKLPSYFIKCHRSYIVNMKHVEHFTTEEIAIKEHVIPISNKQKSVVFDFMNTES